MSVSKTRSGSNLTDTCFVAALTTACSTPSSAPTARVMAATQCPQDMAGTVKVAFSIVLRILGASCPSERWRYP
ncbi:exported hypothetical protein [Nitrolancea hollandica Lb]|uniref:Uncharacterized protein n=1 Tax=Nitrolancea hollandica Lb TaxID=1129897 RepID=I4ECF9_9BACT|nr:exported hypothetical protein [Nitrolancea hollandica Lb]